jgi:hypothetical protein
MGALLRRIRRPDKAYVAGYDKCQNGVVKQQYWLCASIKGQRNQVANVGLYPVQLSELRIDGVTFNRLSLALKSDTEGVRERAGSLRAGRTSMGTGGNTP